MRELGPIFWRFTGPDRERGPQYVQMARTLLGRTKAYLQDAIGSKTWKLSDGTVIQTSSFAGHGGDIVEIRPAPESLEVGGGHYFVYLFGGKEIYGTDRCQGWKFVRGSDVPQRIAAGADLAGTTGPYFVDNSGHEHELVMACTGLLRVYKADPLTGALATVRSTALPSGTDIDLIDLYATQVQHKYVAVIVDSTDPFATAIKYYLYDAVTGAVTVTVGEEPASYVRNTVGRSSHHPTEKLFYRTEWVKDPPVAGLSTTHHIIRAFSYVDPTDAPTQVAEWIWTVVPTIHGADHVSVPPPFPNIVVVGQFGQLCNFGFGGTIVTRVNADGVTPLEHIIPATPHTISLLIPAHSRKHIDLVVGGGSVPPFLPDTPVNVAPWGSLEPILMPAFPNIQTFKLRSMLLPAPKTSTHFFVEYSTPVLNNSVGPLSAVRAFRDAAEVNRFQGYAEQYYLRTGQTSIGLIDGTRVVRSVGQIGQLFAPEFPFLPPPTQISEIPRLFVQKPMTLTLVDDEGADPLGGLNYLKRADIPLSPVDFNQFGPADLDGHTDVIRRFFGSHIDAMAVYEPRAFR